MEKYKKVIKNNKFKISTPTLEKKIDLTDGSYSVSGIQNYFEYINQMKSNNDCSYSNKNIPK